MTLKANNAASEESPCQRASQGSIPPGRSPGARRKRTKSQKSPLAVSEIAAQMMVCACQRGRALGRARSGSELISAVHPCDCTMASEDLRVNAARERNHLGQGVAVEAARCRDADMPRRHAVISREPRTCSRPEPAAGERAVTQDHPRAHAAADFVAQAHRQVEAGDAQISAGIDPARGAVERAPQRFESTIDCVAFADAAQIDANRRAVLAQRSVRQRPIARTSSLGDVEEAVALLRELQSGGQDLNGIGTNLKGLARGRAVEAADVAKRIESRERALDFGNREKSLIESGLNEQRLLRRVRARSGLDQGPQRGSCTAEKTPGHLSAPERFNDATTATMRRTPSATWLKESVAPL